MPQMRELKVFNLLTQQENGLLQNQLLRQVFEESSEAILFIDTKDFTILDCNKKTIHLFQAQNSSDLIGRQYFTLYSSEPIGFSKNHIRTIIHNGEEYSQELSLRTIKNQTFWGRISIKRITDIKSEVAILRINKLVDYVKGEETLTSLINKTAKYAGVQFFKELARLLTVTFDTRFALIGTIIDDGKNFRILEYYAEDFSFDNRVCSLDNSLLENTLKGYTSFYPRQIKELFPDDQLFKDLDIDSYLGTPVYNSKGNVQGALIIMDNRPMTEIPNARYILSVFSSRVGAEIERLKAEDLVLKQSEIITRLDEKYNELRGKLNSNS